MPVIVAAFFGSAILGASFFKIRIGSIDVLTIVIAATVAYYAACFIANRFGRFQYEAGRRRDWWLWLFFAVGTIAVALSYAGIYANNPALSSVFFDGSYIPRQAYYLFFIPLIILAAREASTKRLLGFIQRHHLAIFAIVLALYLIRKREFAFDVRLSLCLITLILLGGKRDSVAHVILLALVLVAPMSKGAESTQIIIRILGVVFYFAGRWRWTFQWGLYVMLAVIVACYIAPFLPYEDWGLDANSNWRLEYWHDELDQMLRTFGLGAGYGSSYATQSFIGDAIAGPFAQSEEFTTLDKMYVVGCHNSFVSIAYRLGFIGAFALLAYLFKLGSAANHCESKYISATSYLVLASLVIVCFNVGFESPPYFFSFAFAMVFFNAVQEPALPRKDPS